MAGGAAKKICATRKPPNNSVEAATVSRVANNDFTSDHSQCKGRVGWVADFESAASFR
jgi:hypothetical protein